MSILVSDGISSKISSEITQKKDGKDVVLIPQPSDDEDDPLVSGTKHWTNLRIVSA